MSTGSGVFCDCDGPPWPTMTQIHVGGESSRFYLCRKCGTIRENLCRPDGTITGTRYHELESVDGSTDLTEILPAAVVEQARGILKRPVYQQGSLFDVDFS
jgi:hypothetical protein